MFPIFIKHDDQTFQTSCYTEFYIDWLLNEYFFFHRELRLLHFQMSQNVRITWWNSNDNVHLCAEIMSPVRLSQTIHYGEKLCKCWSHGKKILTVSLFNNTRKYDIMILRSEIKVLQIYQIKSFWIWDRLQAQLIRFQC